MKKRYKDIVQKAKGERKEEVELSENVFPEKMGSRGLGGKRGYLCEAGKIRVQVSNQSEEGEGGRVCLRRNIPISSARGK